MIFLKKNKTFLIQGPAGHLEILTTFSEETKECIVGIVCHPHPLYGGTMHNKVVTTLVNALNELRIRTIRFNFRGVGRSQGQYDNGVGELEDLKEVIRWVKKTFSADKIWLAGFSFGAYISAKMAYDQKVAQLISIAPPIFYKDFSLLTRVASPWLIVQGDQDEIVPFDQVEKFIHTLSSPVKFIIIPGASHFFHGQLIKLRELLIRHLISQSIL